ncbi:MAG TPA: MFS transporter [Nitrolancea sp.]|nr:MFS transporter [Nitrolancea sp.]
MLARPKPTIEKIREQFARFPRSLWLLAGANFVLFCARGMTIPFLVIFFGQIVGLGAGFVGAGIAASSIVGVAFTLIAAGTIDRFGARTILIITIVGTAVTTAFFPISTTHVLFFSIMILQGIFTQLYWPASDTLATSMVPVSQAGEMFAMLRVASALGIGAGGLIGGLIVVGGAEAQYRVLYLSAATGIAIAGLLIFLLVHPPARHASQARAGDATNVGSWCDVLSDRRFMYSQIVMFILLAGLTQLQVSAPPYLRAQAHLDEALIGFLFTINTAIVVVAQLWVARKIAPWGRGTTLAVAGLFWAVAYALIGASVWSTLLPCAAIVVYTMGEMVFMPTSGVITVELAPEHLRGRYLAFSSVIWGSSYGLASWAGGAVLSTPYPGALWPAVIVVLAIGAVGGLFYDRFTALPLNTQRVGIAESD